MGILLNGIRLTGSIASFDMHAVLLQSPNGSQTVCKHAVAMVCEPYTPIFSKSQPSSSVARRKRRPPWHSRD
ncbi:hypothetical protein BZM27_06240 [Paraburkholderia steynii]|uniref:RNA chaperone Hfq n=1 Tax=Paraburkholderia steynii TaxID=1245441 RepID=A0A4R0XIT0_9BURK|nr:hypothetical protein BZM27_06240 [Paraburkholderia steynii]